MRRDHQGLTTIPLNLLHQLTPIPLKTMMITAYPSYSALIASRIMLIRLGNSGGGLIMFDSSYLMRRRVIRRRRKNLAMKRNIRMVWSRMMNM